jgi:hypothetical protein
MRSLFVRALYLFLCLCAFSYAKDTRTTNTLIPILKLQAVPKALGDCAAVAFSGEVGRYNYRAGATLGFLFQEQNYLKFSSEYLVQKLGYHFPSGTTHRWTQMVDVSGAYKRTFTCNWLPSAGIAGYWASSPNKSLHSETILNKNEIVSRRIAGARAEGGSFGATIKPFCKTALEISANYDHVEYRRKFHPERHVSGWGGTFDLNQTLFCNLQLQLRAEMRRPFNYFLGNLHWKPSRCGWLVGFFGSYTKGKAHLPNSTAAGVQVSYAFGQQSVSEKKSASIPSISKPENTDRPLPSDTNSTAISNAVCATDCCPSTPPSCANACLIEWVSTPAVYLPEVLAIVDPKISTFCIPINSSATTSITLTVGDTFQAPVFGNPTGPITYSSDNPTVASVDSTGLISASVGGAATIYESNCGQPPVPVVFITVTGG